MSFLRRVCYITTWAYATWLLSRHVGALFALAKLFNLPAAPVFLAANAVHLPLFGGMDLWFGSNHWGFLTPDEQVVLHVRASLLVFVPLSYAIGLLRRRIAKAANGHAGVEAKP